MSSFSLTKKKRKKQILRNKEKKVEKACRKWNRAKSFWKKFQRLVTKMCTGMKSIMLNMVSVFKECFFPSFVLLSSLRCYKC